MRHLITLSNYDKCAVHTILYQARQTAIQFGTKEILNMLEEEVIDQTSTKQASSNVLAP